MKIYVIFVAPGGCVTSHYLSNLRSIVSFRRLKISRLLKVLECYLNRDDHDKVHKMVLSSKKLCYEKFDVSFYQKENVSMIVKTTQCVNIHSHCSVVDYGFFF